MTPAPFVAHVSRWRVILLIAGAIVMTAGAAFVAFHPDFAEKLIGRVAAWAGIFFFPLCAIVGARQLFRTGPVMEIGPAGLRWKRWSDETIPWSAFTRAGVAEIQRQRMVTLWLADPEAHGSTTLLGRLAGANKALGFGDISLTAQGTGRRFEEIAEAVYVHAPHLFGDPDAEDWS